MIHVVSEGSMAVTLNSSGLVRDPADILAWGDALQQGPVVTALDEAGFRVERARFLAEMGWEEFAEALHRFELRDSALTQRATGGEEVVIWFSADLHDQLQLLQVLERVGRLGATASIAVGVGEPVDLDNSVFTELPRYFEGKRVVGEEMLREASDGWRILGSGDPMAIEVAARRESTALPHVPPALLRFLAELPSHQTGLSQSEETILRAVDDGSSGFYEIYSQLMRAEERPFMSPGLMASELDRLADGPVPLVSYAEGEPPVGDETWTFTQLVSLTVAGRDVLEGRADAVALRGIDRWIGGLHLAGPVASYRWDRDTESVVRVPEQES